MRRFSRRELTYLDWLMANHGCTFEQASDYARAPLPPRPPTPAPPGSLTPADLPDNVVRLRPSASSQEGDDD